MGVLYILLPWESERNPLAGKSAASLPSVNALFRTFNWIESSGSGGSTGTAVAPVSTESQLEYVEQTLRLKDNSHLSPEKRERRYGFLDYVNVYNLTCNYQGHNLNADSFENSPVCYLLTQTADSELVESCKSQKDLETLASQADPRLVSWLKDWGMNLEEIQMIQGM